MRLQAFRAAVLAVVTCAGVVAVGQAPAFAASPVVTTFTPASGTIGTTVTITGSGFSGVTKVVFGTVPSQFTVTSSLTITATVPAAASTGPIKVTGAGGTASSRKNFTVDPGIVLSATSGPPTGTVKVSGAGFGASEVVAISFGNTQEAQTATTSRGTFSGAKISIPASAVPGTYSILAVGQTSGRAAQASFTVDTDWAQWRYSAAHTGFNPYENVLSAANVSGLQLVRTYSTNGSSSDSSAAASGAVYSGCGFSVSAVCAFDAATGAQLWSFPTGQGISAPAESNGVVYASTNGGLLFAVHASTGAPLWVFGSYGSIVSPPTVAKGAVYIGAPVSVYGVNAATGAQLWSFSAGGIFTSPAVANGVLYVSNGDGVVYALNAATGATVWSTTLGNFTLSTR